jgi:hypothetical protein
MWSGKAPKAAEWPNNGWVVEGEVIGTPKSYHVREFDKENPGGGKLRFYSSGDPVLGVTIDLKTSLRELGDPEDAGIRRAYVDKTRLLMAVRDAVRAAGADGVEVGGYLSIMRTGTEDGQGTTPATTWAAKYQRSGQWQRPVAIPAGPPEWAQGPRVSVGAPQPQNRGGWQGQPLTQPQVPAPGAVDVWSGQPTPGMPAMAHQHATQAASMPSTKPTITASAAAALVNGGVDVSGFNTVPG